MLRFLRTAMVAAVLLLGTPAWAADYVPPRHEWARQPPAQAGFDQGKLAAAVEYAKSKAEVQPADMRQVLLDYYEKREPGYRILGPVVARDQASGLIVRGGRIVAEWGDIDRVDMTFSVAKSYLATVAGLAVEDRAIASVDNPVAPYMPGPWFEGDHNGPITWKHLLQQTSDWSGTLWDVHDWADRPEGDDPSKRPLHAPGTHYKYNDVRVNLLALALLNVMREPLPRVLKSRIMDPDWRLLHVALAWLRQFLGAVGRPQHAVGVRRRAFRRRHVHQRRRPCALRLADAAQWSMGWPAPAVEGLDRALHPAIADESRLRLPVVAQHRPRSDTGRAGIGVLGRRLRWPLHLHRSRARPGRGVALDTRPAGSSDARAGGDEAGRMIQPRSSAG